MLIQNRKPIDEGESASLDEAFKHVFNSQGARHPMKKGPNFLPQVSNSLDPMGKLNIDSTRAHLTIDASGEKILGGKIDLNQQSFLTALDKEPIGIREKIKTKTKRNRAVNRSVDFDRLDKLSRKEGPYALRREGRIRELANLTDLKDVSLEKDLLRTLDNASPKSRQFIEKQRLSREGHRYYTSSKRDFDVLKRQSLEITRK